METYNTYFPLANRSGGMKKIQFSDIMYLEGSINYTLIHLTNGKVLVSSRTLLFHIEQSLNDSFMRIHRAYCVNKQYVRGVVKDYDSKYVMMEGDIKLSVSRRKGKNIKQFEVAYQLPVN